MKRKSDKPSAGISEDAAIAATKVILEEFFFIYSKEEMQRVGCRIMAIIQAATDSALEFQRRTMLDTTPN